MLSQHRCPHGWGQPAHARLSYSGRLELAPSALLPRAVELTVVTPAINLFSIVEDPCCGLQRAPPRLSSFPAA